MIHDCIVIQPLTEIPIDSEAEFAESDAAIDSSDDDNGLEERMDGVMIPP